MGTSPRTMRVLGPQSGTIIRLTLCQKTYSHSKNVTIMKHLWLCLLSLVLLACESNPVAPVASNPPKPALQFVDLKSFDRDLAHSLAAPLPRVEVSFLDRVAPSALPERIQQWMASVESGGGKVVVVPPASTVSSRSPLMLISAISTLWSASKVAKDLSTNAQFQTARAYDAQIILKLDDQGGTQVDRITFLQRGK